MKKIILLITISICLLYTNLSAQVGIGTTTPNAAALLHIDLGTSITKGFLVTGNNLNFATLPSLGAGCRLMFYPGIAAFRAGRVDGTQWDNVNVGSLSTAMGYNTIASGGSSTAMGYNTIASGGSSTALGNFTISSGNSSIATGFSTTASGNNSTAMGTYVNTNNQTGAFIIGDSDPLSQGVTYSGGADQFVARFYNGYYLLTSGDNPRSGVQLAHNGNSWVSICDKNLKENFEPLSGEEILQKISSIPFMSWNYKKQDPKIYRHYGIMAQDFNSAFGHDKYGTIGNDTTVNPIDMIGIDMAAIQALEKRTNELRNENTALKIQLEDQNKENNSLKQSVAQLQAAFYKEQTLIVQKLKQLEELTIKSPDLVKGENAPTPLVGDKN